MTGERDYSRRVIVDKFKEFVLEGCINVPEEMDENTFFDEFITMIESKNWIYGGGLNGYVEKSE